MERIDDLNLDGNAPVNPGPSPSSNPNPVEPPSRRRARTIRKCPYCKQDINMEIGFKNWKKLFRWPTIEEWITLFIIVCVIAMYFVYQHDIKQYQNYIIKNCNSGLKSLNNPINSETSLNLSGINNITNITYVNENQTNQSEV